METHKTNDHDVFDFVSEANRVGRTARMLDEKMKLKPNQRKDIAERALRFINENGYTQKAVAREVGIGKTTISEVLRLQYKGNTSDAQLVKLHNWIELTARRQAIVKNREFVETTVACEILTVAGIVAETCQMGVIFGPARIGKTITLKAIEGDQAFGDPVLITVNESTVRPFALCRAICEKFELSIHSTFDAVFRRLINRLKDTKRMLMFDEADLAQYPTLEMIRQLHDATGCPVLLAGKPKIYEHLGLREMGNFSETLDQMAGRIAIKRDLTERTRGENGEPLYTLDDIRKMIRQSGLMLDVSQEAKIWLQTRASTLGMGGIGKAMISLYLAFKVAYAKGDEKITAEHLEDVDELALGHEDACRVADIVAESSGMRRVV